jgi:hypothetical protein
VRGNERHIPTLPIEQTRLLFSMWRGGYVFSPWVVLAQMAAVQAAFYGSMGVALFLLAGEK